MATLKSSITLLENKISDLENQLKVQSKENLASKISDLENQLKVLPEAKPAKNKSINDDNMNLSHASVPINVDSNIQVTTVINSFLNEEKEKTKRRLNLIIHNIPESTDGDGLTRKKHDIDLLYQPSNNI